LLTSLLCALSTLVASEVCDVCINRGENPTIFVEFEGSRVACPSLFQMGQKSQGLSDSQCLEAQYLGITECGCRELAGEDVCFLCEDKTRVATSGEEIFNGFTCTEVEQLYVKETNACAAIQQTAGVYCGCQSNSKEASCRICPNDSLLYDPTRVVTTDGTTVPGGSEVTCAQIEYTANLPGHDCSLLQAIFSSQCCISAVSESLSTSSPLSPPSVAPVSESLSTSSPSSPQSLAPTITDNTAVIAESTVQNGSGSAKASMACLLLLATVATLIL
jgi:hypothetical protein